jgi:pyruvate-formate lyase-activating enzyme
MRCGYCFNTRFAHTRFSTALVERLPKRTPAELVSQAVKYSLALTTDFVEPAVIYDFVMDTFVLAREQNVPTILSFAGSLSDEALAQLLPYCTVIRLDVKASTVAAMKTLNAWIPGLYPQRPFAIAKLAQQFGCRVEYTIPVIPEVNDAESDLRWFAEQIVTAGNCPVGLIAHQQVNPNDLWHSATDDEVDHALTVLRQYGLTVRKAEI